MVSTHEDAAPSECSIDTADGGALDALVRRCLPDIRAHVRRRLGSHIRAKCDSGDIVQDALLRFLRYCPNLPRVSTRGFCALMARIVENVIRDKHGWVNAARRDSRREVTGSAARQLLHGQVATGKTPSGVVRQREDLGMTRFALGLLNPLDRAVILGRVDRVPYEALAASLGITREAAMSRHRRAQFKLLKLVQRLESGAWHTIDWAEVDADTSTDRLPPSAT